MQLLFLRLFFAHETKDERTNSEGRTKDYRWKSEGKVDLKKMNIHIGGVCYFVKL